MNHSRIKLLITGLFLGIGVTTFAQTEADVLRYSQLNYTGTARYNAMGGAFNSLGADISVMSTNPAGIAQYSKNEFSFTAGVSDYRSESTFENTVRKDNFGNFNFPNVGFVGVYKLDGDIKSISLGIAHNKLNTFRTRQTVEGVNSLGYSILDQWATEANSVGLENIDNNDHHYTLKQAFNTYLVDTTGPNGSFNAVLKNGETTNHQRFTEEKGYQGETAFSVAINTRHNLLLGASIGVPYISYNSTTSHYERAESDQSNLDDFTWNKTSRTEGYGVNGKFGFIFTPSSYFRIGASIHTATYYELTDEFSTNTVANYMNGFQENNRITSTSDVGIINYALKTPGRYQAGISSVLGKFAIVSLEVNGIDYSRMRIKPLGNTRRDEFDLDNQKIREDYQFAMTYRAGLELRSGHFTLRGGYVIEDSPYKDNNNKAQTFSTGLGFRSDAFSFDLAYSKKIYSDTYYMYEPEFINSTTNDVNHNYFTMTLGFRY